MNNSALGAALTFAFCALPFDLLFLLFFRPLLTRAVQGERMPVRHSAPDGAGNCGPEGAYRE